MSVSNNPNIGAIGVSTGTTGIQKGDEASTAVAGAPAKASTPDAVRNAVQSTGNPTDKAEEAVNSAINTAVAVSPPKNAQELSGANNAVMQEFKEIRFDTTTSLNEKIDNVSSRQVSADTRQIRDAAMKNILFDSINKAIVSQMTGVDAFSADGVEIAKQITDQHQRFVNLVETVTESGSSQEVAAAGAEIEGAIASLLEGLPDGPEKTDALQAAAYFSDAAVARSELIAKMDDIGEGFSEQLQIADDKTLPTLAEFSTVATGVSELEQGARQPFVDDSRLDGLCREVGDMAAHINDKAATNANLVDGTAANDPQLADSFQKTENALLLRLGKSAADNFHDNAEAIGAKQELLATDSGKADSHISALSRLVKTEMTGTAADLEKLETALRAASEELYITSGKRTELDAAINTANERLLQCNNSFEAKEFIAFRQLLASDLPAGVEKANELLGLGSLSDATRAKIVDAVGAALTARNDDALAEVNDIANRLDTVVKRHSDPQTGRKAAAADRTEIAGLIEELSTRIDAAMQQVENDLALLGEGSRTAVALGDSAAAIQTGLQSVKDNVDQVKQQGLKDARDAIAIMRFSQKVDHRLSLGIALNRGVSGLVDTLSQCDIPQATLDSMLGRLAGGDLTVEERMQLAGQLRLVLTHSQIGKEPLNTSLNHLINPDPNLSLSQQDRRQLSAAAAMIVSKEAAETILPKITAASAENSKSISAVADALVQNTKAAAERLANGGTDAADRKTLMAFGEKLENIRRQASLTMTAEDYAALNASLTENVNALADDIVSAAVTTARKRAGLSEAATAFTKQVLLDAGFDMKALNVLLGSRDFDNIMQAASSTDPLQREKAWDSLMGDRPDLDDVCLQLKQSVFENGKFTPVTDKTALRQTEDRHASDRLVRSCKALLQSAFAIKPSTRAERDALLALPNDQFLARSLQGAGISKQFDLFTIRASWLQFRSRLSGEGEGSEAEFQDFQASLPPPYDSDPNLRGVIVCGLASSAEMDSCQNMVGGFASAFDRSKLSNRFLDFAGSVLNKTFSRPELMDNLLAKMSRPPHRLDASRVKNSLLSGGASERQIASFAADAHNNALIIKNGSAESLTFKERAQRLFHRKSKTVDRTNLSEQINRAAVRSGNVPASTEQTAEMHRLQSEIDDLRTAHERALEMAFKEVSVGRPGEFKSAINMSVRTVALETALNQNADWKIKRDNIRSIEDLKSNCNVLSMEEGVGVSFKSGRARRATERFKTELEALKNATTEEEFNAASEKMQKTMRHYHLPDRAKALLVAAPAAKDAVNKKLDDTLKHGFFEKNPVSSGFKKAVRDACQPYYKAIHTRTSHLAAIEKRIGGAQTHDVGYYISDGLAKGLKNATTVALLDQFEKANPSVGFADFAKDFAEQKPGSGFDQARTVMTNAIIQAGDGTIPRRNAEKIATVFLTEAAQSFLYAKGGPTAEIERQSAGVKDPDNLRFLDKQFKKHRESALAIRNGMRDMNIDDLFTNIHKNGSCSLDTEQGLTVSYEDSFNVSAALSFGRGVTIRRDGDNKYSLMMSNGVIAGLDASVSAASEMLTASVSLEGKHNWGYQFDFADEKGCKAFLSQLLAGQAPSALTDCTGLSVVTSTGVTVKAEASASIGEKIDSLTEKLHTAQELINAEKSRVNDTRRLVDLELSAQLSASTARESVRSDQKEEITHKLNFSGSIEGKLQIGKESEVLGAEKDIGGEFSTELTTNFTSGKLVGATMTRNFTIPRDASEADVKKVLADYGIDNPGVVAFAMEKIQAGNGLTLSIDAKLTASGLEDYNAIDATGPKGLVQRSMHLTNRENFDVSEVRVTLDQNKTSRTDTQSVRKAAENDSEDDESDETTEKTDKSGGVVGQVRDMIDGVQDRVEQFETDVRNAAVKLVNDNIKNEKIASAITDQIAPKSPEELEAAKPGFWDKISVDVKTTASGEMQRQYRFPILQSA